MGVNVGGALAGGRATASESPIRFALEPWEKEKKGRAGRGDRETGADCGWQQAGKTKLEHKLSQVCFILGQANNVLILW